jgi:O-antigen/teichoic acid export membrane protein
MATVSSVGVFSIVGRVSSVASVSSLSIYVSSRPAMAQLHDRGDRETLTGLYTATTRWTLGLNLPFFLVMVLFADPLLLLFGEDFGEGATALTIMAFGELVNAGTGTCQGMLDMTGHTRAKLANTVLWTVLLIGGSALAIPRWGIVGAATASFVAIAAVNVAALIEVRVLERIQPYDRTFWKPVVAAVGALVVGIVVQGFLPVGSHLGRLVLEGGLVGLVYVGLIFLLGLAPDDRLVLERAWAKVTKRSGRSRPVPETAGGSR